MNDDKPTQTELEALHQQHRQGNETKRKKARERLLTALRIQRERKTKQDGDV